MKQIAIINKELLNEKEKAIADKLLDEYYSRIQMLVKNPLSLKINIKEYDKGGKGRKYSINAEAIFSGGKIVSSSSWDWDLARTIHKTMIKIQNEIEKKFKVSKQH